MALDLSLHLFRSEYHYQPWPINDSDKSLQYRLPSGEWRASNRTGMHGNLPELHSDYHSVAVDSQDKVRPLWYQEDGLLLQRSATRAFVNRSRVAPIYLETIHLYTLVRLNTLLRSFARFFFLLSRICFRSSSYPIWLVVDIIVLLLFRMFLSLVHFFFR